MTDKEKEEIDKLNRFKTITVLYGNTFTMHIEQLKQLQGAIETVLNLIQTQQEVIEDLKWKNKIYVKSIKSHKSEIEKKDTLIHTMRAEFERLEDLEDNTDMLKLELQEKDRQLEIKDKYLELIYFLGVDYDGWNTVESLKSLIDNLIDYVKKAGNNDDKAPIYSGFNGENFNILYERLENKGDIENG